MTIIRLGTRPAFLLAPLLLACAAAPLPSTFTRTDCAGRSSQQCRGPQGNVLSVHQAGTNQELLVDGNRVLSVQGRVGQRAEWHLLGHQLTGLLVPVSTGGRQIYAIVRLAGPDAQSTCLVASTSQGGPAHQLASRAQDMSCVPEESTEIGPQHP